MSKKTHEQQLAARKAKRQAERQAEQAKQRRNLAITVTAVVAVVAVLVGVFVVFGTRGDDTPAAGGETPPPTNEQPTGAENKPKSIPTALAAAPKRDKPLPAEVDCSYKKGEAPAKKVNAPEDGKTKASGTTKVSLNTSVGDLQLTLDSALAPCTVKSFLSLTGQKYFDNTTCHRLTVGDGLQVLQCGDPSGSGSGGPGYSFADEVYSTLKYGRGIVAMANAGPATNGSQFFIVYGDASALGPQYTAFGTIDEPSLKILDKVAQAGVKPQNGPTDGAPATPVKINTATSAA
ncbi:peptidylprolyl isomerase [Kribbella sandramycini]|uniref:Peptidyl-prolyl cis-trans isomerase n=1 Tax=Kribbella sandramycini TaxID=60450 RepID=A0A7Y4P358_9ACTN|nr:peptidylprolyl isomerase [Kribbella sandramycini]MBB6566996.1 peptidyl-prolyl cis-trans isomerase B (cyclophilin B) [Kribbella sandramycini]NOL44718.1 peptidylprolyl isomerase [Kribbella sandramycini]